VIFRDAVLKTYVSSLFLPPMSLLFFLPHPIFSSLIFPLFTTLLFCYFLSLFSFSLFCSPCPISSVVLSSSPLCVSPFLSPLLLSLLLVLPIRSSPRPVPASLLVSSLLACLPFSLFSSCLLSLCLSSPRLSLSFLYSPRLLSLCVSFFSLLSTHPPLIHVGLLFFCPPHPSRPLSPCPWVDNLAGRRRPGRGDLRAEGHCHPARPEETPL